MWKLDNKEAWVPKNWCFWIVVLEKTLETPLDSKEIKPVNPKGNQPWIFIGRLMLKLKLPYWPPDGKSRLIGKDLVLVKVDGERRRGVGQRMRWLDSICDSMDMIWANSRRQWTEEPGLLQSVGSQRVGHDLVPGQQLQYMCVVLCQLA